MKVQSIFFPLFLLCSVLFACHSMRTKYSLDQHVSNPKADSLYHLAEGVLARSVSIDSSKVALSLIDRAIAIDSLNPAYYGTKAQVYIEFGWLPEALRVQCHARDIGAVSPATLLQLGFIFAAMDSTEAAHHVFDETQRFATAVLDRYPDSLSAYYAHECAKALYASQDSLFMPDAKEREKQFARKGKGWQFEMYRRVKPSRIIKDIIQISNNPVIDFDIDSLIESKLKSDSLTSQ